MTGRFREWWERTLGFLHGTPPDSGLEDEFAAHLELAVEDNLRRGMSPEDARRAALIRFGGRTSAMEHASDQRGLPWLESFFKDLAYAFRGMRRSPAFTGVAVLTLALGIGANTALFSLVEAVLLRHLPVRDPGSLYFLVNAGAKGAMGAPPYPCYELFRDHTRSFEGMAAIVTDYINVTIGGQVEQAWGEYASGSYFDVLGVRPAIGRVLTPSDDQLQPPVAVLSYAYWQRRFGGDPGVLGKTVSVNQKQLTIVGVTESKFTGMAPGRPFDITVPFELENEGQLHGVSWFFDIVARVRPGVDPRQARAEIDPIFRHYLEPMADLAPDIRRDYLDHMELAPAANGLFVLSVRFGRPLLILMVVVAVVLLVGCSNLANLFMARASSREKEFAIRLAIGAGRFRLARQLFTETMLLFASGTAVGLLLAVWGSRLLAGFLAVGRTPLFIEPELDSPVLAFTAGVALLTGLVFGVLPALGPALANPLGAMHGGGRGATDSRSRTRVRQMLVAAQVALSLILLVGGGLFLRTLENLNRQELGFRPQGVLTLSVLPSGPGYNDARLDAVWTGLLSRVRQIPGVASASVSVLTPLSGRDRGVRAGVAGYQPGSGLDQLVTQNHVSDGYFETFGIPLVAGRAFTPADREGAPPVAIINEAAARFYFPGRNPVGATIETGSGDRQRAYSIVGVAADARHMDMRQEVPRFLYIPTGQRRERLSRMTLAVKTVGDPARLTSAVEREVHALGPDMLVSEVMTLQQQVDAALVQERLLATVGGFFSLLALVLSAVGLYGLLSHVVSQRTGEIGIRMALGADSGSVVWMILRRSVWLMLLGLAAGIPAALLAARPLASLLYGLQPADPATLVIGIVVLFATAMLASYLPARRAARIDPLAALRSE